MAPIRSPVAGVTLRAGNASAAASSLAPPIAPQTQLEHGQDKLSIVKDPKLPVTQSENLTPALLPPIATWTNPHVAPPVNRVPRINEEAAKQNINEMTTRARGLWNKWPLEPFYRLVCGGKNNERDAPAQPKEEETSAKDIQGETQEEDIIPPPPYIPS